MKDKLVSFETAKLAKEKGFDVKVYAHWYKHGNSKKENINNSLINTECNCSSYDCDCLRAFDCLENYNHNEWGKCYFSAPTQSLLQKWLREKHDLHINITRLESRAESYKVKVYEIIWQEIDLRFTSFGESYEEALESGLQEALKLIKE